MQAACQEKEKKVLVDEATKKEAQHKLSFKFFQKKKVKGKSMEINFYEPVDFNDEELTKFPFNIKTHLENPEKGQTLSMESLMMLGSDRQNIMNKIMKKVEGFVKNGLISEMV